MPNNNGILYPWEQAELNNARDRYRRAVDERKMHPNSDKIYESLEKKAFAELMSVTARYGGCR